MIKAAFLRTWQDMGTYLARVFLPLLLLLSFIFFGLMIVLSKGGDRKAKIGFVGKESAPVLVEKLVDFELVTIESEEQLAPLNEADSIDLGIAISSDFLRRLEEGRDGEIVLYFDSRKTKGLPSQIVALLDEFEANLVKKRLDSLGLDRNFVAPLVVSERDSFNWFNEIPRYIGGLVPFFMVLFSFLACIYSSFDLFRERDSRRSVAWSKWLMTTALGLDTAILTALGLYAVLAFHPLIMVLYKNLIINYISLKAIFWILLALAPLLIFFAIWLSLLRLWAGTYKRAQNVIQSLKLFILLSFGLVFVPGMTFEKLQFIPGANVVALGNQIILKDWAWGQLLIVFAVLIVGIGVGAAFHFSGKKG